MSEDGPDLSTVTNDELVQELMDRHAGVVVIRESQLDAKGERNEVLFDFSGGVSRAIGLAERFKNNLLKTEWAEQNED